MHKNNAFSEKIVFYVSTQGNDAWSGKLPEPAASGKDGPFATLARARDELRVLKRRGKARAAARVFIRGGRYELDETLVFGPEDSGTEAYPVTYCAYPGEVPVVSGGRRITGWSKTLIKGRECWKARLPEVKQGKWYFSQLFVNGLRRFRPRLPKKGAYTFASIPDAHKKSFRGWGHGPDRACFKEGDIKRWRNRADIKIMALQLWFETHHRIKSLSMANREIRFRAKSIGTLFDENQEPARYWVENVFEALDSPAEWYLDRPSGTLYYIPFENRVMTKIETEKLDETEIIAPRLNTIVSLRGSPRAPVGFIRFENISFQHAEWDYPEDDAGSVQAAFKVPGAILLERAEHCVFYGCTVAHIAQYGVEMLAGCHNNRLIACSIHDTGAGGVKIGHEWIGRIEATSPTAIKRRRNAKPMAAMVSDCSIHHGGIIHLSAVGIWIGNAGHNRILHNHIHDYSYTGISCGWMWGFSPTATFGNRIEYNHVHHINWNEILSDNGGIYTLGVQPGSTIRGNHLHHVSCYGYGGWGLYPDQGSSEMIFENNLVHHTKHAGFSGHYGRDLWVRNNIFALSRSNHIGIAGQIKEGRFHVFEKNILFWREGQLQSGFWHSIGWPLRCCLMRDNLFWGCGKRVDFGPEGKLEDWQALGQLKGTVVADPLFTDPESGDFDIRPDSPVLTTGFKPFDWRKAGPRRIGRRPLRFEDWPADADKPQAVFRSFLKLTKQGVRLTIENIGAVHGSGKVRLTAGPSDTVSIKGKSYLRFRNLKPGAGISAEFRLGIKKSDTEYRVETEPGRGAGILPTFARHAPSKPAIEFG